VPSRSIAGKVGSTGVTNPPRQQENAVIDPKELADRYVAV
jgi:hypothetical protein